MVSGADDNVLKQLKKALTDRLAMTDMGEVRHILEMAVTRDYEQGTLHHLEGLRQQHSREDWDGGLQSGTRTWIRVRGFKVATGGISTGRHRNKSFTKPSWGCYCT